LTGAFYVKHFKKQKLSSFYYTTTEICQELDNIDKIKEDVYNETMNIYNDEKIWNDWPEKDLLKTDKDKWKIFPFYAFGIWVKPNCAKCPIIFNFLKNIKNIKLATLSRLSPGTKLNPHKGWGKHSNYVIRCHYGIVVPSNCYVFVERGDKSEIKYHKQFEWTIFDDSLTHYACNGDNNSDRIVLIIDVKRPDNIEEGTSDVGDTKELLEIVKYFEKENIDQ
jgi:beta-hydroxylase